MVKSPIALCTKNSNHQALVAALTPPDAIKAVFGPGEISRHRQATNT